VRLIIHLQFDCIPLCSCVCSRFAGKDLAFLVRLTVQRRSITRGVVVLRLQGSEPSCSEAGSNCVVTPPNRELLEPFRRSGTLVHINTAPGPGYGLGRGGALRASGPQAGFCCLGRLQPKIESMQCASSAHQLGWYDGPRGGGLWAGSPATPKRRVLVYYFKSISLTNLLSLNI
jgi:hypothetical protein